MSVDESLIAWIEEALAPMGLLSWRRMMGGATLYLDGTIFAIVANDELWFKSDAEADPLWDREGCGKFSVTFKDGRVDVMNYRRAPADVYDDADALQRWATPAVEAGLRAGARKRPRRGSKGGAG